MTISEAANDLFQDLIVLRQTESLLHTKDIIILTGIEINMLLDKPIGKEEVEVTVTYLLKNAMNEPRRVTTSHFDFDRIDMAADRIAEAIRYDLCEFYDVPPVVANYLELTIENLQKLASTLHPNLTTQYNKDQVRDTVIKRSTATAKELEQLQENERVRVFVLSNEIIKREVVTKKLKLKVDNKKEKEEKEGPTDKEAKKVSLMPEVMPSGLDPIKYDLLKQNPIGAS